VLPVALALLAALLPGCRDEAIRSYEVPKEAVPVMAPAPPATPAMTAPAHREVPHWTLPRGWREVPGSGMRFATLVVEGTDPPLEVRVTPLSHAARDLLDNVNRWRQQIGLDPVTTTEVGPLVRQIDAGGRPIDFVSLTGPAAPEAPAKQILAGILPGQEQVWFFLMFDEAARVAPHAAAFEAFLGTVHLETHHAGEPAPASAEVPPDMMPAGDAPASSAAPPSGSAATSGAGGMTWTLPPGWSIDPTPGDMRVATIRLPEGGGEVAITRFGGPGGDLLANINRWRNQLGLAPVAGPADQAGESITVAGRSTRLFDMSEAGSAPDRRRTMVVGLAEPDANWFIKVTGPHAALAEAAPAFRQFLGTVRIAGEATP
jgi:hypothetical protein